MWTKFIAIAAASLGFIALLSAWYLYPLRPVKAEKIAEHSPAKSIEPQDDAGSDEYVLEIIGLGVTLDGYRQGVLWDALAHGKPFLSIRDPDPRHYPWDALDKMNLSGSREGASIENAVIDTPRYWGIPAFNAAPRYISEMSKDRPDRPQSGIVRAVAGQMHMLVLAHRELSEQPDRVIEKIFRFFDQNPSVPFIVLGAGDSTYVRTETVSPSRSMTTGYYVPEMPDASAVFVIARRERVDAIRPFVFKDLEEPQPDVRVLNRDGVARRVWLNYLALEKKVPTPPEENSYSHQGRQPTSEEWLADMKVFAKQFDPSESSKAGFKLGDALSSKPRLSRHWKPTPWFPVPWNTEQLEQFDKLPTLGFLHRPVFVKMTDDNGKRFTHAVDREAALLAGWKQALDTLPEVQRAAGPARVIVATGSKASQLVDFHGLLRKVAEEGGPTFDPELPNKFINTDHRLGNTGAATFFMQTAIGVMGSYREGGVSAAFNLRDPGEASIIFISPPSDEKRKSQQHPIGGDVLQNATVPLIDPKNYEEPVYR